MYTTSLRERAKAKLSSRSSRCGSDGPQDLGYTPSPVPGSRGVSSNSIEPTFEAVSSALKNSGVSVSLFQQALGDAIHAEAKATKESDYLDDLRFAGPDAAGGGEGLTPAGDLYDANSDMVPRSMLDKERTEKLKLQSEIEEQLRLHAFEKNMLLSRFEDESNAEKAQKEDLKARLRSSQIYERSLIRELKTLATERDELRKEVVHSRKQQRAAQALQGNPPSGARMAPPRAQNSRRSTSSSPRIPQQRAVSSNARIVSPARPESLGVLTANANPAKRDATGQDIKPSSVRDHYTRYMKNYARQLQKNTERQSQASSLG